MRLEQLKYLIAIDRSGSFTAASAQLSVAQLSISRAINALEKELGFSLFERNLPDVKATPVGKEVIASANAIVNEMEHIYQITEGKHTGTQSSISVSTTPELFPIVNQCISGSLEKDIPILYNVQENDSTKTLKLLKNGSCDLVLILILKGSVVELSAEFQIVPLETWKW